jgi:hypothetical protein
MLVSTSERLHNAERRFAAAHASDPSGLALAYHARLKRWVTQLAPDASEAQLLAAGCQHMLRWTIPRRDFPEGLSGYKRWRSTLARMHADEAEKILRDVGYEDDVIESVRALLVKKGLKTEPTVQLFEDAICLTFIEGELEVFATKHDDDKLVRILQKTWKKMSPHGHAAATELAATLDETTRALIARAVG